MTENFNISIDKCVNTVYNTLYTDRERILDMFIYIDNKSGTPIYEQIYNQIKKYIVSGMATPDEPLPSIRNLAKDLKISVITTKRAYEDLEKDGYIYTVPSKGCFIAPLNQELMREESLKKIEAHIEEIEKLAVLCGMTKKDISNMIDIIWEDKQ